MFLLSSGSLRLSKGILLGVFQIYCFFQENFKVFKTGVMTLQRGYGYGWRTPRFRKLKIPIIHLTSNITSTISSITIGK